MKSFKVTVNGSVYEVDVEEMAAKTGEMPTTPAAPAAKAAPVAKPAAKPASAAAFKVEAPMPGTILEIKVNVGQTIEKNQVVAVLEAMKMENEIVSPKGGVVAGVHVSKGQSVNSGDLLISLL